MRSGGGTHISEARCGAPEFVVGGRMWVSRRFFRWRVGRVVGAVGVGLDVVFGWRSSGIRFL